MWRHPLLSSKANISVVTKDLNLDVMDTNTDLRSKYKDL